MQMTETPDGARLDLPQDVELDTDILESALNTILEENWPAIQAFVADNDLNNIELATLVAPLMQASYVVGIQVGVAQERDNA